MLPDGDLDTSMTLDESKQKLETYLHDFDLKGIMTLFFCFFDICVF